jgi:hypothetical protein
MRRLLVSVIAIAALAAPSVATAHLPTEHHWSGRGPLVAAPGSRNLLDCNGWSPTYPSARPAMKALCTDPIHVSRGKASRFIDNGWYVGHDEPSVKFISSASGSGNTMTYYMQLPTDPSCTPDASGTCTDYAELSVAPWFGLPICDPNSDPQNPCTPDSDSNSGSMSDPNAAGSAFMELQFYPPGFTPFADAVSCSQTQWCAALTIDSLECNFGGQCNPGCEEPVNFAFLETDGVPAGPAAPESQNIDSFTPDGHTLMMNAGDVLKVSITDPASGLTTTVDDLTRSQTGYMQASSTNGFANTSSSDCSGSPFTFHAEYDTAKEQNQVPWAALEGGVLMEQEIGHFEPCTTLANKEDYNQTTGYDDPNVYQTCNGGIESPTATGEGPCDPTPFLCTGAETQGSTGPAACPTNDSSSATLCEYSDGYCFQTGSRTATLNGSPVTENAALTGCFDTQYQNGDLDFEGTPYHADWPDGSSTSFPTSFRYAGPFTSSGAAYPDVQLETDVAGSENLCHPTTGSGCSAPPTSAAFYPFWSLNNSQTLPNSGLLSGTCVWNFGNDISGVTAEDLTQDGQYGSPDVARYGGTLISGVIGNPANTSSCNSPPAIVTVPTISGTAEPGDTLSESHGTWTNSPTSYTYQWQRCDSSGNGCGAISGASAQTYTLTSADLGHTIEVQEIATGIGGPATNPATSAHTAIVGLPLNTAPPTISGNLAEGQTLTEAHGSWSENPTSYTYQWQDCDSSGASCSAIAGASAQTYTLTSADVGHTIRVVETASNSFGPGAPANSAATGAVVAASAFGAPRNVAGPAISGTAVVGKTLSASSGLWQGSAPLGYAYQWQRCKSSCTDISGATGSSYQVAAADLGANLRVVVAASNSLGFAFANSSEAMALPNPAEIKALLGKVLVPRGKAARIGKLLSAHGYPFTLAAPSGDKLKILWRSGKLVVAKLTATFSAAGKRKLKLKLTPRGRRHLLGATLKVTAQGTFTPTGIGGTSLKKTFTLRR